MTRGGGGGRPLIVVLVLSLVATSKHPGGGARAQADDSCEYLSDARLTFPQSEDEPSLYGLMRQLSNTLTNRHGPHNVSFDWEAQDFRRKTGWHDIRAHVELPKGRSKCYAL